MTLEKRIILFSTLGSSLESLLKTESFQEILQSAKNSNPWFTIDNLNNSIKSICQNYLVKNKLEELITQYPEAYFYPEKSKNVGLIAAGNIPLVGFQDFLHILLSGHKVLYKPSSQDEILILFIISKLKEINPEIEGFIEIVDKLNNADAYIATGSGNSARYFEYYFSKKPHIIRKNRTSVGILDGNENKIQLANLGNDIFDYFGLGCRNVSKLFVPIAYNFQLFFESIEYWNTIRMHSKYNNNYDYMKSIYLVNRQPHLDNGFLLLKEDRSLSSPISVLFYEEYESTDDLKSKLNAISENTQVIVNENLKLENSLNFGASQKPGLCDYADNIDVMEFLSKI
jgi:hypothetical protein